MGLRLVETEAPVVDLSLDILARDGAGQTVAIENQLEATNHDHLGRLLIYAAGCDARIVIWVATEFKGEHRAAINRLNTWTREEVDFYGVEVRVVKIGASRPAPDFRLVVRPDTWSRQTRRDASPDNGKRRQFDQKIVDRLREQRFTNATRAVEWNSIPSKFSRIDYFWRMAGKKAQPVAVYLEIKTENSEEIFSYLELDKETIEEELGEKLLWKRKRKLQILLCGEEASIDDSPDQLDKIENWIFEHLRKLKQVFDPRLEKIVRQSPPEEG